MALLKQAALKLIQAANAVLPNVHSLNYALAAPHFRARHGRFPRRPASPKATLNDFIFHRMVRDDWTPRQIRAVDKEFAKAEALFLCPDILVPETVGVIPVADSMTALELSAALAPYAGGRLIAKPTHGSGTVVFLDRPGMEQAIPTLLASGKQNFFRVMRETQYDRLERKIIVERNISPDDHDLIDYKFLCFSGKPAFCQVDIGRFGHHRRQVIDVSTGRNADFEIGPMPKPDSIDLPTNFGKMVDVAARLASISDFVRIDLYNVSDRIYFSEFTFSPCAGTSPHRNDEKVTALVRAIAAPRPLRTGRPARR